MIQIINVHSIKYDEDCSHLKIKTISRNLNVTHGFKVFNLKRSCPLRFKPLSVGSQTIHNLKVH